MSSNQHSVISAAADAEQPHDEGGVCIVQESGTLLSASVPPAAMDERGKPPPPRTQVLQDFLTSLGVLVVLLCAAKITHEMEGKRSAYQVIWVPVYVQIAAMLLDFLPWDVCRRCRAHSTPTYDHDAAVAEVTMKQQPDVHRLFGELASDDHKEMQDRPITVAVEHAFWGRRTDGKKPSKVVDSHRACCCRWKLYKTFGRRRSDGSAWAQWIAMVEVVSIVFIIGAVLSYYQDFLMHFRNESLFVTVLSFGMQKGETQVFLWLLILAYSLRIILAVVMTCNTCFIVCKRKCCNQKNDACGTCTRGNDLGKIGDWWRRRRPGPQRIGSSRCR